MFIAAVFIIALLYFTGVFRALGISSGVSSSSNTSAVSSDNKYDDADFSFEFIKPWKRLDAVALEELGSGFEIGVSRNDPDGLIGIKSQAISDPETDLKKLGDTLDEIMTERLEEFNSKGTEVVKINGTEALKYSYDFKSSEGAKVAQRQYIFVKDDYAYYVVFHASFDKFSELEADFDKIISTFKLKK